MSRTKSRRRFAIDPDELAGSPRRPSEVMCYRPWIAMCSDLLTETRTL